MAYFYKIRNKRIEKYYVGSRSHKGNPLDDLLVKYFTSSKIVKRMILETGTSEWLIEEIVEFSDYKRCVEFENEFLRNIDNKEDYLNINFSAGGQIIRSKTHTFITNDGIKFEQFPKGVELPAGYYVMWPFSPPSRKGIRKYLDKNGNTFEFMKGSQPEGFMTPTEFKRMGRKNKIHITNGIISKKIDFDGIIPDGWSKGRKITKSPNAGRKKGHIGTTNNKICINNGIVNKFIETNEIIPEGWIKGLLRNK